MIFLTKRRYDVDSLRAMFDLLKQVSALRQKIADSRPDCPWLRNDIQVDVLVADTLQAYNDYTSSHAQRELIHQKWVSEGLVWVENARRCLESVGLINIYALQARNIVFNFYYWSELTKQFEDWSSSLNESDTQALLSFKRLYKNDTKYKKELNEKVFRFISNEFSRGRVKFNDCVVSIDKKLDQDSDVTSLTRRLESGDPLGAAEDSKKSFRKEALEKLLFIERGFCLERCASVLDVIRHRFELQAVADLVEYSRVSGLVNVVSRNILWI
jgi:hypothetical protein